MKQNRDDFCINKLLNNRRRALCKASKDNCSFGFDVHLPIAILHKVQQSIKYIATQLYILYKYNFAIDNIKENSQDSLTEKSLK